MAACEKKPIIILTGPTAVGKTALSIALAKAIDGEIISADSMQVYKQMDIGSAKITKDEMEGVPHHLVDVLDPREGFDVCRFQSMAKEALAGIYERGRVPIVVGGTGFYIQALLYDIDFTETKEDTAYRRELSEIARTEGNHALHEMLKQVDPESAEAIHENNDKRVMRALEFYQETGEKISAHNEQQRLHESPYQFCYFVLTDDRKTLYDRIDERVDLMLEQGLVAEVQALKEQGCRADMVSMKGLGYKEILAYLDGQISLEEAVYIIKRDTRHFAKRQLTWFRRERDVIWLDRQAYQDEASILEAMLCILREQNIYMAK